MTKHYGYVIMEDGSAKHVFDHGGGRECVLTNRGFWLRRGQGMEAICREGHAPPASPDPVNQPSHYNQLPVECIDVAEHFGYLLGNVIKYVWRHQHKGKPLEDLRKARFYLDRAIQKLEEETNE